MHQHRLAAPQIMCADFYYTSFLIVPSITISGNASTLGDNYELTCEITDLEANSIMYQWRKQGTMFNVTGPTLFLPPLQLSDAGLYICHATFNSNSYYKEHKLQLKSTLTHVIYRIVGNFRWCKFSWNCLSNPQKQFSWF